jgi:hypothetical protein
MSEEKERLKAAIKDLGLLKEQISNFEKKHNCGLISGEKDFKREYSIVLFTD